MKLFIKTATGCVIEDVEFCSMSMDRLHMFVRVGNKDALSELKRRLASESVPSDDSQTEKLDHTWQDGGVPNDNL
jgi:hypothetical protein